MGGTTNPASRGAEDEEGGFNEPNNTDAEAEQERRRKRHERVYFIQQFAACVWQLTLMQ